MCWTHRRSFCGRARPRPVLEALETSRYLTTALALGDCHQPMNRPPIVNPDLPKAVANRLFSIEAHLHRHGELRRTSTAGPVGHGDLERYDWLGLDATHLDKPG